MTLSIGRFGKFAAIAALTGSALIYAAPQATFHLPVETHWGQAVLAPGDYNLFLPAVSLDVPQFRVEHAGKSIFAVPLLTGNQDYSASNYLKLADVDGQYYVTEFSCGMKGKTFTFSIPKPVRRQLAAAQGGKGIAVTVR